MISASICSTIKFLILIICMRSYNKLVPLRPEQQNLMVSRQESSDQVMQQLYKREIEPNLDTLPKNTLEGFSRLCANPKYTYFESDIYYRVLNSRNFIHCDVTRVPGTNKKESVSIAIRKGSSYKKFFNYKSV
jgi:hypothetical protein